MRHHAIRTLFFTCLCVLVAPTQPATARDVSRPNIVFLLADDLGFGDLHCYGHPYARTPNLDKLAADGTRFLQFHSTGCTCCPARTGLMTSKFPATYPTYPANGGFADHVTITELLKKQGYVTGHFGKWHIGPITKNGTYGIDSIMVDQEDKRRERVDPRGRDATIYDKAIAFIEQHKDEPFYVNVWGHMTHHPVNPPQVLVDKWTQLKLKDEDFSETMRQKIGMYRAAGADVGDAMRRYLSEVEALDANIGRLLQRLDEMGLRENTIVVFSSDQGSPNIVKETQSGEAKVIDRQANRQKRKGKTPPAESKPTDPSSDVSQNVRFNLMGYNGEHRGGKHTNWEGGLCVPFILRWPGHATAGRVDETSIISGADWLPTLCHLTGISVNAADFDGEDVSAAWLGGNYTRTKSLLWKTSTPNSEAVIREGPWKLFSPSSRRGELELYDVPHDSLEKINVAAAHPDIVEKLKAKVDAWRATLPKSYLKTGDKQD
jgi:N-acetylgalactosamine-6-sulfatase